MADTYTEAVGRRKTAVARVRLSAGGKGGHTVNGKPLDTFFGTKELQNRALSALQKGAKAFNVSAKVAGGGLVAQAEAIRHGIARALVSDDAELRVPLKKAGYLKRDPRMKERKKFGLKKARRAPQWSKR